ncbi:Hypothetical predicted protein [Mytilus galloprovincialis]|uniref:C1q domain-containing protein n=1 Tax=Mytilus galloprovincialis TaxID=29158 RepID=A0A8B6HJE7_MYTGA|nr:Hypothetical predicted protein [Mytilus galloprovincialis]
MEMNDLKQDFDNQLASFQTSYNATINDLHTKEISMQKQITENNERDKNYPNVIRFNNVQLSVGITNISAFKSTGKFVCEKEGLYLVAVSVVSKDSYSSFCVYHRGMVSCTEIGQHFGVAGHSGTSVATLHLQVNDNVRVETSYTIEASYWTQFTLIKIK